MKTLTKLKMLRVPRRVQTPLGEATRSRPIEIVVTPSSGNGQAMTTALELRDALTTRGYRTALEVFSDLESLNEWSFDRFYFEGESYGDRDNNRVDVEAGPFAAVRLGARF